MIFKKGKEKKAPAIKPEDKVPMKEKIAYGCGGISVGMQETADNQIMAPVFVVGVGISPAVMSTCGMIYRVWDAFTDAIMGWVSDNTRTRWGRRRPYIFIGAFLMAAVMPVLFLFGRDWSIPVVTAWMIGISLLLYAAQTVYNVPYQALLYESSVDTNERTNVAAWRAYFGLLTQIAVAWTWWLTQRPIFYNDAGEPDVLHGAPYVIGVMSILVLILGIMPAVFMKERYYHRASQQAKVNLKDNFKYSFQSRSFVIILLFALLFSVGTSLHWGLNFYVKLYYVCGGDQKVASTIAGLQSTLQVVASYAGIPAFQWLARRIGKKICLLIIFVIVGLASASTFFLYTPANPYLAILPFLFIGPAITGLWVIIPSMIGDAVDEDELKTQERREGAFASIFGWGTKMARSTASLLSGYIVVWVGFEVAQRHNIPMDVLQNMRVALALLPFSGVVLATIALVFYPLTSKRVQEIREELEARRGKV
jgi:GPH family glycoside/pentoside/hexuronide:cation symporter